MTFWQFLDRRWPSDRAWVTMMLGVLVASMLKMADHDRTLWNVELFKTLLTLVLGTGFVNMVLAFYFAANKGDDAKTANTAKAFEAIAATAKAGGVEVEPDVTLKPGETAQAEPAEPGQ